jgi:predicted TIM-barrel fold metal-dependent hydrolase
MMSRSAEDPCPEDSAEAILDPHLPIVDAHHHLWFQPESRLQSFREGTAELVRALTPIYIRNAVYLFPEFSRDANSGHNLLASVFVDANLMYRAEGPVHLRGVGEVEFVNGVAAMSASGNFGPARLCAGIVGRADLTQGERIEDVLLALIAAAPDRFRGVRWHLCHDDDSQISPPGHGAPHVLASDGFRAGFARLAPLGLSFEAYVFEPQLPELVDLARVFPDTAIVLNHVGGPIGMGRYRGTLGERFPGWRVAIRRLAACPNVVVKLGGLGMPHAGFGFDTRPEPATATELAEAWRPYIETCIEAFGAERCMFGSNFPVDSATCSYAVLWNAFKLLAGGASEGEKAALFSGTAARTYRLTGNVPALAQRANV